MAQVDYKEKCLEEVEKIKDYLITHYPVKKIILFGSLARGVITPQSDIEHIMYIMTISWYDEYERGDSSANH